MEKQDVIKTGGSGRIGSSELGKEKDGRVVTAILRALFRADKEVEGGTLFDLIGRMQDNYTFRVRQ